MRTPTYQFRPSGPFEFAVTARKQPLGYVHRVKQTGAPYPQWWVGPRTAPAHGPYRSMLEAAKSLYHRTRTMKGN